MQSSVGVTLSHTLRLEEFHPPRPLDQGEPWTPSKIIGMAQTSIHLCPCKASSEIHNKREKELDYVRPELSPNNEWWSGVESLGRLRSEISALVKEKTGRKMQAKAEPLREGVVVIQEGTTMGQLQELGSKFKERFGVTLVQIAIHRDEGHWVDSEGVSTGTKPTQQPKPGDIWKPNLHAHLVFDWYNHDSGKSIKTSKLDAVDMQTICAEVLGMERGVSSERKHMEAAEYKAKARIKELEDEERKAKEKKAAAEKELREKAAQLNKETGSKLFQGVADTAVSIAQGAAKLVGKGKLVEREKRVAEREKKANEVIRDINNFVKNKLPKQMEEQKNALEAQYKARERYLEDSYSQRLEKAVEERTEALKRKTEDTEDRIARQLGERLPRIVKEAGDWGLNWDNILDLAIHGMTQVESVKDPATGNVFTIVNNTGRNEPVELRWDAKSKGIIGKICLDWHRFKEWCRAAVNHAWCAINGTPNYGRKRGMHL